MPDRQQAVGRRVAWIERDRPLEPGPRLSEALDVESVEQSHPPQHAIVCLQIVGVFAKRPSELCLADLWGEGASDAGRDLVLEGEQVAHYAVEVAGPHDGAVGRLCELDRHAHPRARAADAAGERIRRANASS